MQSEGRGAADRNDVLSPQAPMWQSEGHELIGSGAADTSAPD